MANFIKARDYFDPRIYERMAQIQAEAALRRGDIRANQTLANTGMFSELIKTLAQLGTQYQQKQEATEAFSPKGYTVGDIPRSQQQVTTDLLGKPITTTSPYAPDFGQQQPAPVTIPQVQGQGIFDPLTDPSRLMQGRASLNPFMAQMAQTGIENLLMQQPKMFEQSPGSVSTDINRFSPTFGKQTQAPFKPTAPKPVSVLLKTETVTRNGREKDVDYYGYLDENGNEVITKTSDRDYTKPKPPNTYWGETRTIKSYQDSFNADPSIKAIKDQKLSLGAVNGLIEQANKGNQVSAAALGVKMAKVMGEVGMLSENDVTRYVQAKSIPRGTADKLTKWMNGVPTEATLEEIRQIAEVLRSQFAEKVQPVIDLHANQMAEGMNISIEDARRYLASDFLVNPTQPQPQQTKQTQQGGLPKITTKEQYDKLPSGTLYIAPDGSQRKKK